MSDRGRINPFGDNSSLSFGFVGVLPKLLVDLLDFGDFGDLDLFGDFFKTVLV